MTLLSPVFTPIRDHGQGNALGAPPIDGEYANFRFLQVSKRTGVDFSFGSHHSETSGFTTAMSPQPIAKATAAMANQWSGK